MFCAERSVGLTAGDLSSSIRDSRDRPETVAMHVVFCAAGVILAEELVLGWTEKTIVVVGVVGVALDNRVSGEIICDPQLAAGNRTVREGAHTVWCIAIRLGSCRTGDACQAVIEIICCSGHALCAVVRATSLPFAS